MINKITISILFGILLSQVVIGQEWVEKMNDPAVNFYEVQKAFEKEWNGKSYEKGKGYKQYKRWEAFMEPRVYPSGNRVSPTVAFDEFIKFKKVNQHQVSKNTANWEAIGPKYINSISYNPGNGRVNAIRVDPNDSNKIYVGTPSGGCWKSTNGGQSWNPISDNLPVIGVTDIAINPNNSDEVYISTGDGYSSSTYSIGVLKSLDGGQSWNPTNLTFFRSQNIRGRKLLMNPYNPSVLWVATSAGLFKTVNGGASWVSVLSGNVYNVKMMPGDSNTVYASTDRFYRSTDGGNSFNIVTNGITGSFNRMEIAVSEADSNVVYAVVGDASDASFEGLYRSTNAGLSFNLMSNSPNIFTYSSTGNGTGGQSWYDLAICANPNNANEIFVGGINVWKSTNGGASWTITSMWTYPNNIGYTHADIHFLEFYNGKVYCGSDGGIFVSNDLGGNWINLSDGIQNMQIYQMAYTEQDSNILMAGSQDNGCNYRESQGQWVHVLGGDGMTVEIDPTNSQIIYYSWQNGGINRSYDAGQNRTNISGSIRNSESGAWVTPFQIDPNFSFGLYAGFQNVWRSTNRGSSWTQISNFNSNATLRQLRVAPSNSNVIYCAPNSNLLRRTTDGGNTWTIVNSGLPNLAISDIEVHPYFPDSVWVTFSGYSYQKKVYVSANGGQSWANISSNLPNLPVNDLVYDSITHRIYIGTDIGIYQQHTPSSLAWTAFNNGLPNVIVNELEINYSASLLYAATYGRGMWKTKLSRPLPTSISDLSSENKAALISIAPNPSQDKVTIDWSASNEAFETLELRDTKGQQVLESNIRNEKKSVLNISALPKGIYFVRLRGQNATYSKKLLIN